VCGGGVASPEPLSPAPLSPVTQWVAFCPHKVPFSVGKRARAGVEAEPDQAKSSVSSGCPDVSQRREPQEGSLGHSLPQWHWGKGVGGLRKDLLPCPRSSIWWLLPSLFLCIWLVASIKKDFM
jgi:hypothetical protein